MNKGTNATDEQVNKWPLGKYSRKPRTRVNGHQLPKNKKYKREKRGVKKTRRKTGLVSKAFQISNPVFLIVLA